MPLRPPPTPKLDAPAAPKQDASKPRKAPPPPLPSESPVAATSQTDAAAAANQAQNDPPPALANTDPPQEESAVEPHDGADYEFPSPADSPPREKPPAVEEPRSAPAVDAASTGGAAPKTSGCQACDLGVCTQHIRLPLGVTIHVDEPQAQAAAKRSGEKPAAQRCPLKHPDLVFEAAFTNGTCDVCGRDVKKGYMIAQCRTCDPTWWGCCLECESQKRDRMKSRDPAEVPAPPSLPQPLSLPRPQEHAPQPAPRSLRQVPSARSAYGYWGEMVWAICPTCGFLSL